MGWQKKICSKHEGLREDAQMTVSTPSEGFSHQVVWWEEPEAVHGDSALMVFCELVSLSYSACRCRASLREGGAGVELVCKKAEHSVKECLSPAAVHATVSGHALRKVGNFQNGVHVQFGLLVELQQT